ncbi:hypothetical protein F2X71_13465 [Alistipes onderdonkii]|nr:hypothetical protein F2X71_13465 [Alistipes onderdonkii]
MVRKIVLSLIAVLVLGAYAFAQNKQVSGTVSDANGNPGIHLPDSAVDRAEQQSIHQCGRPESALVVNTYFLGPEVVTLPGFLCPYRPVSSVRIDSPSLSLPGFRQGGL